MNFGVYLLIIFHNLWHACECEKSESSFSVAYSLQVSKTYLSVQVLFLSCLSGQSAQDID